MQAVRKPYLLLALRREANSKRCEVEGVTMTKAELIDLVAAKAGLPKNVAVVVVDAVVKSLTSALSAGQKVEIRGFGSFHLRVRRARMGRNPKTGESVHVEEKRIPVFRAGKELKEAANRKPGQGDAPPISLDTM